MTKPSENQVAQDLLATHSEIEALLQQLCDEGEGNAQPELQHTWDELERKLLLHLAEEELYLFPALTRDDPDEVAALERDHADFRRLLAELGVGIELHTVRLETLEQLRKRLNEHARREDDKLYRWAAASPEPGPRTLLQRIRRRITRAR